MHAVLSHELTCVDIMNLSIQPWDCSVSYKTIDLLIVYGSTETIHGYQIDEFLWVAVDTMGWANLANCSHENASDFFLTVMD